MTIAIEYELPVEEIIIEWLKITDTEIHLRLVELDATHFEQAAANEEESMAITEEEIRQESGIADVTNDLLERIFEPVPGSALKGGGGVMTSTAPLRQLRKASLLTRAEFAEAIGVDRDTVKAWEHGREPIPDEYREELATRFGVRQSYLVGAEVA